jgi:hypothetical protein
MNTYVITVWNKDKAKNIICHTDKEMFEILQNAIDEKLVYEVNKAQLELMLTNKTQAETTK